MKANRYNTFNQVHKGLRALLYDTAMKLQQTDLSNSDKAISAIEQVRETLYLFESHANGEDYYFNEPLEKSKPEVAQLFQKEHEEDHRLGNVISHLLESWAQAETHDARREAGKLLFYSFNEFIAFNLYHMNKEEIELNAALWVQYSDDEIRAIEQTLVQNIPPAKMEAYGKWMIRGLNDVEIAKWLGEVRDLAPAPVFTLLDQIAKTELPPSRYDDIQKVIALNQRVTSLNKI